MTAITNADITTSALLYAISGIIPADLKDEGTDSPLNDEGLSLLNISSLGYLVAGGNGRNKSPETAYVTFHWHDEASRVEASRPGRQRAPKPRAMAVRLIGTVGGFVADPTPKLWAALREHKQYLLVREATQKQAEEARAKAMEALDIPQGFNVSSQFGDTLYLTKGNVTMRYLILAGIYECQSITASDIMFRDNPFAIAEALNVAIEAQPLGTATVDTETGEPITEASEATTEEAPTEASEPETVTEEAPTEEVTEEAPKSKRKRSPKGTKQGKATAQAKRSRKGSKASS